VRKYIVRRLVQMIIGLFLVASVTFLMFRLLPGDPTASLLDPAFTVEIRETIIERFGLNEPIHVQYIHYLQSLVQGDFGRSFYYRRPSLEVLGDKIWNTLILMLSSMIIAYGIGVIGGMILSWKRGSKIEWGGITLGLFLRSAPMFWTGMLLIMLFAFNLGWLPHSGMRTPGYEAATTFAKFFSVDFLRHLLLPMITASLYFLGTPLLIMRNTMLETHGEDYIELSRAKGLSEWRIMILHAGRNALLPVITAGALFLGQALGGQVVVEYVFGWPGLGREIVLSAQRHDYPVAQTAFLFLAFMVMLMNLVADLFYSYLDPRVKLK